MEWDFIANSGLQFAKTEIELNPEEPLQLPDGRTTLRYTFIEKVDFLDNMRICVDVCAKRGDTFVPVDYLRKNDLMERQANGTVALDALGVPIMKKDVVLSMVESYQQGALELFSIGSLQWRVRRETPDGRRETVNALDQLLGHWLPMPMYELEVTGQSMAYPHGWCRVKMDPVGERQKNGRQRFRLTWAFDTALAKDMLEGETRPGFFGGSGEEKHFSLCNRVDNLLGGFLNIPDGQNDAPVADYISWLLGIDLTKDSDEPKYKFLCYYIYLINYLRLWWDQAAPKDAAAPKVTLYNKTDYEIPVDMSVDIGNSRTCAMLFENGDFTKAKLLRLRDMSEPWLYYEDAFDMRVVFRKADFGNDLTLRDKTIFRWPSLVRVGEEAKHLIYRAKKSDEDNKGEDTNILTSYSSPKRYLWDGDMFHRKEGDRDVFDGEWKNMVVEGDATNQKTDQNFYIEGVTDFLDDDGTYLPEGKQLDLMNFGMGDGSCHYSRRSLMTFVMIEMMQQAHCFINSHYFRNEHKPLGTRRYLRNVIVTCPTAMPMKEQLALRQAAKAAADLLHKLVPTQPEIVITPDPEKLKPTDDPEQMEKRGWLYDEALASQLVYLYAELKERYDGRVDQFFSLKGHQRKEMEEMGFEGKQLTIGTVDIGAGTTDVMVVAYGQKGQGRLTPVPLYYDSFYTAGDDILHNVIRDIILEDPDTTDPRYGSIGRSLQLRIQAMSCDELLQIPRVAEKYSDRVEKIRYALTEEAATEQRNHLTYDLMHHFFASDANLMSAEDRQYRLDFCTQISHPMSQFFLEQLRSKRPAKVFTFEELFEKEKPANHILERFRYHFGFGFEELEWRYDPEKVGQIVRGTMVKLMEQLSVVMYAYHCDALVLSGRPTSLEPLTELFVEYLPLPPNRLVLLNSYRVGQWFPQSTGEGYFEEKQKSIVAVGAEVGRQASTTGFNGLVLDFSPLAKTMKSTACFMGPYDSSQQEVRQPFMTPDNSSAMLKGISVFPYYIGCKQFDAPKYQARPIYAIYNHSSRPQLNIMLQRNYFEDREELLLDEVTDMEGETVSLSQVELRMQTLANDGSYWLDKGDFTLNIQEKS